MNWLILYSKFSACPAIAFQRRRMAQYLVIISENSWIKTTYLKKQTQFFPVFTPKTTIPPNPNPIQSQFKPNQTQSKPNFSP